MRYHYLITLAVPSGLWSTVTGTVTPAPGETRSEVYLRIYAQLAAETYPGQQPNVLFWSLEPEALFTSDTVPDDARGIGER